MISAIISRIVILLFGTLYPAYASYKAVRTKNVKEYVKWMMYWIVFALFSCVETITDIFLAWFPFYYEVKIIIVLWLLSPATKGSSTLYRKFVHPMLTRREQEIDEYINQAKERGYTTVLQLGTKGVNYATNVIMQTAIKTLQQGLPVRSQSENTLSSGTILHHDTVDGRSYTRSHSVSATYVALHEENPQLLDMSSDDEEIILREIERKTPSIICEDNIIVDNYNDDDYNGAARSRVLPQRKTKKTMKNIKKTLNKDGGGIRGRRKLKQEQDFDIDIE